MKIVLRKEDSSTSNLLFIYNIVYSKTKKDRLNLSSLIEIMKCFNTSESATRMALSRACKSGILSTSKLGKEVVYTLTPLAIYHIQNWNIEAQSCWNRLNLRNSSWDGKWNFIHINLKDQTFKDVLHERLQRLGYFQINVQTWLSPYNQINELNDFVIELNTNIELASINGDFNASKGIKEFIELKVNLTNLNEQYITFLNQYEPLLTQLKDTSTSLMNGGSLPILHKLGYSYFAIALKDPMLPRLLLPIWKGDTAAILMKDLRQILVNATWEYLKNYI